MSKKTKKPATLEDIFDAVNSLTEASAIDFKTIKEDVMEMKAVMVSKTELKQELAAMETRLVTKDYLDKKLSDLKGDLTGLTRKEDGKLVALITELGGTKALSSTSAKRILALEPFSQ